MSTALEVRLCIPQAQPLAFETRSIRGLPDLAPGELTGWGSDSTSASGSKLVYDGPPAQIEGPGSSESGPSAFARNTWRGKCALATLGLPLLGRGAGSDTVRRPWGCPPPASRHAGLQRFYSWRSP